MEINLDRIIEEIKDKMKIEVCCCEESLKHTGIDFKEVNVLGLELNGYFKDFHEKQIQVIDSKGLKFVSAQGSKQDDRLSAIFSHDIPAVIFTDGNKPDEKVINLARANNIPILRTELSRQHFIREFERKLEELLAPKIDCRGTMMEILGLGVLISGKSNVGKSECAIDLLQRGHRLIGDDIVEVTKRAENVLIARGKFPISHKMELRGIGIVDVVNLFGISAIKEVEKIELIIELERWDFEKSYERLGIEEKRKEILGVSIPYIEIPVASGRNTAILVEVAVMNYRLRERGIIPAVELDQQVIESYKKNEED